MSIPSHRWRTVCRCRSGLVVLLLWFVTGVSAAADPLQFRGLLVEDPLTRPVVEDPTLVRQLDPIRYVGSLRSTEWLMDRPDLAAALARRLHPPLEPYRITAAGEGEFEVADGGSLRGTFRLIASAPDRRLYRCDGQFRAAARYFHVGGRLALFLEYRELPPRADEPQMEILPALYIRFENLFVRGVATLLGPMLRGVIDRRVANLAAATRTLSRRIVQEPRALYTEMARWPEIRPADLEAYRRAFLSGGAAP